MLKHPADIEPGTAPHSCQLFVAIWKTGPVLDGAI
jgi:hypothetical protein